MGQAFLYNAVVVTQALMLTTFFKIPSHGQGFISSHWRSAVSSGRYFLTVSEIFPLEIRAMAIARFYAVGTCLGGVIGPLLFGRLVESGVPLHTIGWLVAAGIVEIALGVEAAQRPLEAVDCHGRCCEGSARPRSMRAASWQDRVDALGRGHHRRYDERTATMLGRGADILIDDWRGDLRRLRSAGGGDGGKIKELLLTFPGIGPAGADIFLREVQAVWSQVAPYINDRVLEGARRLEVSVPDLLESGTDPARLCAALVRVSLSKNAADEVRASL